MPHYALDFPKAAAAVDSFYVEDCLSGAYSKGEAIDLHQRLVDLFVKGNFLLRKWNCSDPEVMQHIKPEYQDTQLTHHISVPDEYTKTLGIEWSAYLDQFRLTVASLQETDNMTKGALVSDIAKHLMPLDGLRLP